MKEMKNVEEGMIIQNKKRSGKRQSKEEGNRKL
jgi:hypothetical protein